MEQRSKQLASMVEISLYDLAATCAVTEGISVSTYLRGLVIADLKSRGMVSVETLERILS